MHSFDWVVVGSGIYGATFAHEAAKRGLKVAVVEARPYVGGNCFTQEVEGVHVHIYGPHLFHTSRKDIWNYINQFAEFNNYHHRGKARVEGKVFSFPINLMTMHQLWGINSPVVAEKFIEFDRVPCDNPRTVEEWALSTMGKELYEMFFKGYSTKQWGKDPSEIPAFVAKRLPYRLTYNDSYFPDTDQFQGIPIGGYTQIFEKMLVDCRLITGVNFLEHRKFCESLAPNVLYTGCLDELLGYGDGKLDYRSLRFEHQIYDGDFQGCAIMNYPDISVPFTRITEHQHFEFGGKGRSVVTREYPLAHTEGTTPYYPVRDDRNNALHKVYMARVKSEHPNYHFGGRLADFQYYDMDMALAAALNHSKILD